jgi:hypothetical protein
MRFEGTITIKAPREKVWRFLTDAEAVAACAPGLESIEVLSPGEKFRAVTALGLGTVKARFENEVEWTDLEPPSRGRMRFHGTAPGSAVDGTATMTLSESGPGKTELAWTAEVTVVGTIASLAARLLGGVAKKLTTGFFAKVRKKIEAKKGRTARH